MGRRETTGRDASWKVSATAHTRDSKELRWGEGYRKREQKRRQELMTSWMWVVRKEHQRWLPEGWLQLLSGAKAPWGKCWTGEKKSQWDPQNWAARGTSGWRHPDGNPESASHADQAVVQERGTGPTQSSRGHETSPWQDQEEKSQARGKPRLNMTSTGQKGLRFWVRKPQHL